MMMSDDVERKRCLEFMHWNSNFDHMEIGLSNTPHWTHTTSYYKGISRESMVHLRLRAKGFSLAEFQ